MIYLKQAYQDCKLNIIQKIYFREHAILFLNSNQWFQLLELNKMILAPYYHHLMKYQAQQVAEAEHFKNVYGKYRYEYENNI